MLLILALFYLSRSTIHAAPVTALSGDFNTADLLSSRAQCLCPSQQRSIWDIVWSCLATIFACSWVSVHPNMPVPDEKSWMIWLRRLELMVWAIIAPEMIIYWAMRQWLGARRLAKQYHAQRWTKTHGYFLQMGGFTLYRGETPQGVLSPPKMEELLEGGHIEFPKISEEEIRDRSKGDGLSKALVIGQTSWFVMQCIARRAQGLNVLNITELELVTSAFAVLNGIMYFLWWNKPLDVRCSVPVRLLDTPNDPFKFGPLPEPLTLQDALSSLVKKVYAAFLSCGKPLSHIQRVIKTKGMDTVLKAIIISPWTAIHAFFSRLDDMGDCDSVEDGKAQVPTFYAASISESNSASMMLLASIIAVIFGSIHCAGWFFIFPSYAELILWRVCSTIITGIPLLMCLAAGSAIWVEFTDSTIVAKVMQVMMYIMMGPAIVALPIYAFARLLLLAEALVALRDLPPGAYEVVQWVTFIPHI